MKRVIGVTTVFILFCFALSGCSSKADKKSTGSISTQTPIVEQTAYQEWIDAISSENKGTKYENITLKLSGVEELYRNGLIGTDDFKKALAFMTGKDTKDMSSEEMISEYKVTMPKIQRYFTFGQEGTIRFLEDIEATGNGWASMNTATGEWTLDFETEDVANHMNLGEEVIKCILGRLCDYGFSIDEYEN